MRSGFYRWFAFLLLSWFVVAQPAHAAAVRSYTGKVNTATSGIIQHKLGKYGFAANDPRFGATVAGAGSGLTAIAGGAAMVAVGAATWPAVLAGAAVATVAGGALYLGEEYLINWLWGDDGTVELSGQGMGESSINDLDPMPGNYPDILDYYTLNSDHFFLVTSGSQAGNVRWFRTVGYPCPAEGSCYASAHSSHKNSSFQDITSAPAEGPYWRNQYRRRNGTIVEVVYEFARPPQPIAPPAYEPVPLTPDEAIEAVPEPATADQLSPEMLAAIANATWKAAQSEPNAVPWPATDPITAQDVRDWLAQNPQARPTVGDLFSPVAPPGADYVPMPMPDAMPGPSPTPGQGDPVDLGDDPNTPPPTMEPTPTAQMILEPIFNLMPDLRDFDVPAHAGSCPTPNFSVLGNDYVWDTHCDLMEQNRHLIELAMLLVWSISAVFIVLRA